MDEPGIVSLNSPDIDICIIGGGVVGTAIARQIHLTLPHLNTLLIEQNHMLGMVTSSRNSEVIHAGLYYHPRSLKVKHCLAGQQKLLTFCEERHIPFKVCGKYIVAGKGDEPTLANIAKNARQCGVSTLKAVKKRELKQREPGIEAEQALYSPTTAIVDSHQYLLSLQADIPAAAIALETELIDAILVKEKNHVALTFQAKGQSSPFHLKTRLLINAAGLSAPALATTLYQQHSETLNRPGWLDGTFEYSKGSYFSYSGHSPFSTLVYPVPTQDGRGLGIHATLDLNGQCRFGPDVEKLALTGSQVKMANHSAAAIYEVNEDRKEHFIEQISRYYPALSPDRLQADYSGIRCQWRNIDGVSDFQIDDQLANGTGLLQYLGIDSPGLTASLSLAEDAVSRIKKSQLFS